MPNDITPAHADAIMAEITRATDTVKPIDHDAIAAEYLAKAKRDAARERWERACPVDMQESNWDHPRLQANADAIKVILQHQAGSKGILSSGPTGRGKSRAMWQLMRRLACDEGRDVRYYHAAEFFSTLQSFVSYGRDDAGGWVEAAARRPIVFIDDLGQESLLQARADWAQGWFFRFLDIRVGEKLPLYVTTNLRAEDMAGRDSKSNLRGDPLLRRLLDLCTPIKFVS